jgi:hypothetical protein
MNAMDPSNLDDVIAGLRSVVETHAAKRAALKAELDKAELEYKRASRALRLLTGESAPMGRPKKPASIDQPRKKRSVPAGFSPERVEKIRQAILEYARDHEEFRQVDIRTMPGIDPSVTKSSYMALGFEALRQQGMIRLARAEGINKWFRLTREAMNGDG